MDWAKRSEISHQGLHPVHQAQATQTTAVDVPHVTLQLSREIVTKCNSKLSRELTLIIRCLLMTQQPP